MNAVDKIEDPHRAILIDVLQKRAPKVLAELESNSEPTLEEWREVTTSLHAEMSEHWIPGSDYEMDDQGLAIDLAMGAFINEFMYVKDRDQEKGGR